MGFNSKLFFAMSLFTGKILTSSHYTNYTIEEDKVCAVTQKTRELTLGKDNRSSIIIQDTHYFENWSGRRDFDCRFVVKASSNMGVFAVIQRMSLRKDLETDSCIDFIQLRPAHKSKLHSLLSPILKRRSDEWDKTYCGQLSQFETPINTDASPTSPLALNAYIARDGELDVRIHIANRKLEPGKKLSLEIAFTSYKECNGGFGDYKSCGEGTCIHKAYFEDKVVNCPFTNCLDEPNCPIFVSYAGGEVEKGLNTKVYVTAVSSIFLSFFLFLGCIMLCRYFDMLCWSEVGNDRATELEQVSPTAPPPDSPDKDLPPAYETLFPSRTSTGDGEGDGDTSNR